VINGDSRIFQSGTPAIKAQDISKSTGRQNPIIIHLKVEVHRKPSECDFEMAIAIPIKTSGAKKYLLNTARPKKSPI
jgi:hypothetical protein